MVTRGVASEADVLGTAKLGLLVIDDARPLLSCDALGPATASSVTET